MDESYHHRTQFGVFAKKGFSQNRQKATKSSGIQHPQGREPCVLIGSMPFYRAPTRSTTQTCAYIADPTAR
jgi:hypothetical protein